MHSCSYVPSSVVLQARQQVKEMVWMKQSENMVLEAVTRLSSVHDALEELLAPSGALGPPSPRIRSAVQMCLRPASSMGDTSAANLRRVSPRDKGHSCMAVEGGVSRPRLHTLLLFCAPVPHAHSCPCVHAWYFILFLFSGAPLVRLLEMFALAWHLERCSEMGNRGLQTRARHQ